MTVAVARTAVETRTRIERRFIICGEMCGAYLRWRQGLDQGLHLVTRLYESVRRLEELRLNDVQGSNHIHFQARSKLRLRS